MNKIMTFLMTLVLVIGVTFVFSGTASAQAGNGSGGNFVDLDGDGINDNAPDHDGDGIPNGQDPDWEKPQDGTGYQHKNLKGTATQTMNKGENKQVGKDEADKSNGDGEGDGNVYEHAIKTKNKGEAGGEFKNQQKLEFKAGEMKQAGQDDGDKSLGEGAGEGNVYEHAIKTKNKGEAGGEFKNQQKLEFKSGEMKQAGQDDGDKSLADGEGDGAMKQNKGDEKQKFQNKVQTFTRTQTMSQVRTQTRTNTGEGAGAGGEGDGDGVCDGEGPKGKRNGGGK